MRRRQHADAGLDLRRERRDGNDDETDVGRNVLRNGADYGHSEQLRNRRDGEQSLQTVYRKSGSRGAVLCKRERGNGDGDRAVYGKRNRLCARRIPRDSGR